MNSAQDGAWNDYSDAFGRLVSVSLEQITAAVAARFHVTPEDIRGNSRRRRYAWPRHVAMWLGTLDGRRSTTVLGRFFDRDHTSIMYGRDHVEMDIADCRPLGKAAFEVATSLGLPLPSRPGARLVDELCHVKQSNAREAA